MSLAYSEQSKSKSLTFSTLLYQSIRIALNRTYQAETKQTRTFSCQLLRRIVYFAPKAIEWVVFYRENCPALILDVLDGFMFALLCAILMNPNWQLLIQNSVSNESKQGKAPNPLAPGSDIQIHLIWGTRLSSCGAEDWYFMNITNVEIRDNFFNTNLKNSKLSKYL